MLQKARAKTYHTMLVDRLASLKQHLAGEGNDLAAILDMSKLKQFFMANGHIWAKIKELAGKEESILAGDMISAGENGGIARPNSKGLPGGQSESAGKMGAAAGNMAGEEDLAVLTELVEKYSTLADRYYVCMHVCGCVYMCVGDLYVGAHD